MRSTLKEMATIQQPNLSSDGNLPESSIIACNTITNIHMAICQLNRLPSPQNLFHLALHHPNNLPKTPPCPSPILVEPPYTPINPTYSSSAFLANNQGTTHAAHFMYNATSSLNLSGSVQTGRL